jgi:hypothetical protein
MVISVSAAGLVKTGAQYLLKCSVVNLNDVRVRGVQLILLVFDSTGKLKEEVSWMERVNLAGYSTKDLSFGRLFNPQPKDQRLSGFNFFAPFLSPLITTSV